MKIQLQHHEIEGREIEITCPLWFGRVNVTADGGTVERTVEKDAPYQITDSEGGLHKVVVRAHFLDPVPAVYVDGKNVLLARKLHRVESFFAVLPVGMFIGRGLLAVLLGYLVISSNFKILRSNWHSTLKWVVIYALSLSAFFVFRLIEQFAWGQK